jgi:hypothetical protein
MAATRIKKTRESNFELLRIFAGLAVVVLHFNYFPGGGGALANAQGFTRFFLMSLQVLCIGAVNIFILLSGYFNCYSNKIKIGRLLKILLQTSFIQICLSAITSAVHHSWNLKNLIGTIIPANYFVILYITMMFLAPFINRLMDSLNQKSLTILITIVFIIFSVYSIAVDILKEITGNPWAGLSPIGLDGSMNGYSIVNFVMVYMIGAWLRKTDVLRKIRLSVLFFALIGCVIILILWRQLLPGTSWGYHNPLLVLEACTIFGIFSRIRLSSKWVNIVAPASFTCFLIQGKILGLMNERITNLKTLPEVLLHLIITVLGIYLISIGVMFLWDYISKPIEKLINRKKPDVQVG